VKAAIIGAPDAAPVYGEFPEPELDEGHELVELVATGIHPFVRSAATGRHYGSTGTWPLIPGVDAVARTVDGDLIFTGFVRPPYGTLAERMVIPGAMRFSLPNGADPIAVAGGMNPGLSSWMPLKARANEIGALGTVLILGVTGMAGTLAVQNARMLGAELVIGAGRDRERLERVASAGAKTVTLSGDRDTDAAALANALGTAAPSIVLDFLWGTAAEAAFVALERRGLDQDRANISYVQIGQTAGAHASVPAALLRSRRIRISGSGAGSAEIADVLAQLPAYMKLIAEGRVRVPAQVFPLSNIAEAWDASARSGNRVVVVPG
jgi:NADPH:quinone reductase-like Zn-dependent oxidoreductase